MSARAGAVFLSYASDDMSAAQRIAQALRSAGIEVWLDQSELRGGEAWDRRIRKEIQDCALFVPVVSKNAHARVEGYFRLEWKLAVDRSHLIAPDRAFLLPVVIDNTPQTDERIPDRFRELQWTRAPDGQVPPTFIERVRRLLSPADSDAHRTGRPFVDLASTTAPAVPRLSTRARRGMLWVVSLAFLGIVAGIAVERLWISTREASTPATPPPAAASLAPAAFSPGPHSIAVLPFMNMSGDKEQDYFSDGLSEELLNDLARIDELQVAARTSAFSFKGTNTDISTIAHKLNVGAVLEGSVRRSGHTIRISAQLINARTGFHLWSETYDRDMGDVLKLQTEIATTVASALKVALLGNIAAKVEVGGTHNPAALDAYLRAAKASGAAVDEKGVLDAIARYSEAIRLDPDYAIAYATRSMDKQKFADDWATGNTVRAYRESAQHDARKAILLAPDLAEGHLALAGWLEDSLDFSGADQEYTRAMALSPGNARVLRDYDTFIVQMGRIEAGLAAAHRSVVLDPLNSSSYRSLGISEMYARRYADALAALKEAKTLAPQDARANGWLGYTYWRIGDYQSARAACESADKLNRPICLAIVYNKLGRYADAEALLSKLQADRGDANAVFYAMIYAQWGQTEKALDWLDTAMRLRDPSLEKLKVNSAFDPLRRDPRFQAIVRALRFPD